MKKDNSKREIKALVKEIADNKTSAASFLVAIVALFGAVFANFAPTSSDDTSAVNCANATCNTTFQVNVQDSITVDITTPQSPATGNVGTFLRNQVDLAISSNVANGFTASMYSSNDNVGTTKTNLTHTSLGADTYISTLSSSSVRSSFPNDSWGYSLRDAAGGINYGETDDGNNSSTYYPLTASTSSPITVLSASAGTKNGSQHIYFGAKASANKASGTYRNTVVISVVTGIINNDNPITPNNPVNPTTDIPNNNTATYTGSTGTGATMGVGTSGTVGTTVYTTTSNNSTAGTTTTSTQVSGGDNTSTYSSPQGVRSESAGNEQGDSALLIGLAATAGVAATAGTMFFILAKKQDDDDDEEEA